MRAIIDIRFRYSIEEIITSARRPRAAETTMSQGIIPETHRFDLAQMPASWPAIRQPGFLTGLFASIRRAWHGRRDRFLLATFDDRALSDIGIGPGAIDHALRYGRDADTPRRAR